MDDINFLFETGKEWRTSLQIQARRIKHLHLFIGPPASGKSTVMKYLLGDLSKLSSVKINDQFSIVETEGCLEHLDTYSTTTIHTMIAKGDDLYVKCPDLNNINLVTSFFLERLLRISHSVRIVFVCDYRTVTDKKNDYKVFWSNLELVAKLITDKETINNVGLIVTKTFGNIGDDQVTLKSLQDTFLEVLVKYCPNSVMVTIGSEMKELYNKAINVIKCFEPQNIGLFKQPVQPGPLNQSRLFNNIKIQSMIKGIHTSETKYVSFSLGFITLNPKELRAMAERCHSATLKNLSNRIDRFHNTRLLACSNETLDDARILLARTIDYLDKMYTGRKFSEEVEQLLTHSIDGQQYQVYKQFFVVEILEFHKMLMQFFKRDYDMTMQSIVYTEVDKKIKKLLSLFPRWEKALGFMETVSNVLSQEMYQTDRHLYNSKDLDDWGKVNINAQHGLYITSESFGEFCEKISCNYNLEDLEEPFGLAYLNNVIDEKLHDPFQRFIDLGVGKIRDKEVVLVFGHTGVGKTTLIRYLLDNKFCSKFEHAFTRYPRFININDVYYVDFPSLEEVRRSENEIQLWIIMKTILKVSRAVKWLNICEVNDLVSDPEQYIHSELQSCVAFMKNLEKYGGSLGIVVNKFQCQDYYLKYSPEPEIRSALSQIDAERPYDKKISQLIEILLARKSPKDSKIAYFFRLNTDPKFEPLFEYQKKQLVKMINSLSFVRSDDNDFVYALSNKAKIQIFFSRIRCHLETHFQVRFSVPSCDIFDLNEIMNSAVESLTAVRAEQLEFDDTGATGISEIFKSLFTTLQMDTKIIDETVDLISNADGFAALNVIMNNLNNTTQCRNVMVNCGFEDVEQFLSYVRSFTRLFIKIHECLSTYSVQSRKTTLQVGRVGATKSPSDANCIDHLNFKQIIDKFTGQDYFKDVEFKLVNDIHIRHFYNLLSVAITSEVQEIKYSDEFRVKGNFILTDRLSREILDSSKGLFLYAKNTIFIDKPLSKEEPRKVIVIAPTVDLRISPLDVNTVFFITQRFKYFGRPRGSLFGAYETKRTDEMNLLYGSVMESKAFLDDYFAFLVQNQDNTEFQGKDRRKFVDFIESKYEQLMKAVYGDDYKLNKQRRVKSLIRLFQ